ncbi:MAG: DUF5915 domain-containing protein, partial [Oscillospiraceae bacterium]
LVRSIDVNAPTSIHLCSFPTVDESRIDTSLESNMDEVLLAVTLGRAARNEAALKNRQPLANIFISGEREIPEMYCDIIKEELNIKNLEFVDDATRFVSYTFKPQLKILGAKYGKQIGEIRTALSEVDGSTKKKELDETGFLTLPLSTGEIKLTEEELLIDTARADGFISQSDRGVTVVLDTKLTPELIEEGFVREIISKIQSMRKEADFNVIDHILVGVSGNKNILELMLRNAAEIKKDTLCDTIGEAIDGHTQEWNINGEQATLSVKVNR